MGMSSTVSERSVMYHEIAIPSSAVAIEPKSPYMIDRGSMRCEAFRRLPFFFFLLPILLPGKARFVMQVSVMALGS